MKRKASSLEEDLSEDLSEEIKTQERIPVPRLVTRKFTKLFVNPALEIPDPPLDTLASITYHAGPESHPSDIGDLLLTDPLDLTRHRPHVTRRVLANCVDTSFARKQLDVLRGHNREVVCVAFSPTNANLLASGSRDTSARLWNLETRTKFNLVGHTGAVTAIAFSSDELTGDKVFTGSTDRMVRCWGVSSGKCQYTLTLHSATVTAISCSPDGKYFASASEDKQVWIVAVATKTKIRKFSDHTNWVNGLAFSSDSTMLATCSHDKTARIYGVRTGECLFVLRHDDRITSVAFLNEDRLLVTGSDRSIVHTWDVATGTCLDVFAVQTRPVKTIVSLRPDLIATGAGDICLWPGSAGAHITLAHGRPINGLAVSCDRRKLAAVTTGVDVFVWDLERVVPSDCE
jgi:WD40 repeat protein